MKSWNPRTFHRAKTTATTGGLEKLPHRILPGQGHASRKSREVFGAEKLFVKLGPLYCVKLVFSYVVKGIKIKITSEFRASRRLRLKIQRESSHPKYARNVSALSRNRPRGARTIFVSMEYLSNLMLMKHGRTPERKVKIAL